MTPARPHLATMPLTRDKVLSAIQDAPLRPAELSTSRSWNHARNVQARALLKQLQGDGLIRRILLHGQQRYVSTDWQASPADIRQHLDGFLRRTADGCLIWVGGATQRGTPIFRIPGGDLKPLHVRRWLYQDAHGLDLPPTLSVQPRCGDDDCVNPQHQTRRTARQYQRGKVVTLAQRANMARGSRAGRARFQWADIEAIRASDQTNQQLAQHYGCSAALIGQIRRHQIWRQYLASPWAGLERPAANDARKRHAG